MSAAVSQIHAAGLVTFGVVFISAAVLTPFWIVFDSVKEALRR